MKKGSTHSAATKIKMSEIHKNISNETRSKMSEAKKGRVAWNKGKSDYLSLEAREKMRKSKIGYIPWNIGIPVPEEERKRISASLKGRCLPEGTKKKMSETRKVLHATPEYREAQSIRMKKVLENPELRKKWSIASIKKWENEQYAKSVFKAQARRPTKPELKVEQLLHNLFPNEWKYVGDGQFILAGKCPDFINVNGKKLIIELYGDYWHKGQDPQDRINTFKPYGYDTLVIWEKELKDMKNVIKRINLFAGGK